MEKPIDNEKLNQALGLLEEQLELADAPPTEIVVCGGSALIAIGLIARTTRDVDIVALLQGGELKHSEPLPGHLVQAAAAVQEILNLPVDWLNSGPAMQLSMGLPEGFCDRLHKTTVGSRLTVHYIDRTDQIYFKTFASADRGGYHISDLKALHPTAEELMCAARWCLEQDPSEGFRYIMQEMLTQSGWPYVAQQI
jgi:hypothetical protein